MGRHQNADTVVFHKVGQRIQKQQFVFEVQRARRLIQHDQRRLLRQSAGKQHKLQLAAGKGRIRSFGKRFDSDTPQRRVAQSAVFFARRTEQSGLRGSTHKHDFTHRVGKRRRMNLRHIGRLPRERLARAGQHVFTAQGDFS